MPKEIDMTSWKAIKDGFNQKCSNADFAADHTIDIMEEECKGLKDAAAARKKLKPYYLENFAFTFFLTDGSNSTLSEIDDDSLSNLLQLERLPVAADHDPAVDVSSTPSDSRFPSPARQSPRAASILKVRRQDFANASSQRSKKGNSSQAGKEQNASVGSTLIRVEKARAAASSSKLLRVQPPHVLAISAAPRVQQSRSSIARTQVQSQRAATVPS